jgi:hypothetical protein
MKKKLCLAAFLLVTTGCTPAAWQNFKNDPAAYIATYENDVQAFLAIAAEIFQGILSLLPPAAQAQALAAYTTATTALSHAELALNQGLLAVENAISPTPNLDVLVAAVTAAVGQIEQMIIALQTSSGKNVAVSSADIKAAYEVVASFH